MNTVIIEPEERSQLEALARTVKDAKTEKRILVILALADGYRIKDIARILRIDEDTVTKWRNKYAKRRLLTDWLAEAHKGYDGKLTSGQEHELEQYVEAETITDAATLVAHIKGRYDITYTVTGVTKLLHRLGFVYKQTTLIPGKLDEAKQAAFKQAYEKLRDALPEDEAIMFGDGVHPSHNVHATKAWVKKGQDKQVKTNTGRKRLNINGVLDIETMETVTYFSDTINAEETIHLFDKIQATYPNKKRIYLILDNARYYKNKLIAAYLHKRKCRVKLLFLPPYSPNLNFIERLWHFMKKYIIGTRRWDKFKDFEAHIHTFFDNIGDYRERLKQFIGTEMHLIKLRG
ncbi:MAG: IS630 family transposase [Patescibacteria group bacterium]|mgnify:CR=1 FL=1